MSLIIDDQNIFINFKNTCFNKICCNFSRRYGRNCREWIVPGKSKCPDYMSRSKWQKIVNK